MEAQLKLKVAFALLLTLNCLLLSAAQGGAGGNGGWGGGWGAPGAPGAPGGPGGYPGAPGAPGAPGGSGMPHGYPGGPDGMYYDQRYRSSANFQFAHAQCLGLLVPVLAVLWKLL